MFWGPVLEITVNHLLPTREPANKSGVNQSENLQASSSERFHVCTTTTTELGMLMLYYLLEKLNILMQEKALLFHTFENNLVSVESPGQRM